MERKIKVHNREMVASLALDKIDEYKLVLTRITDSFKHNHNFELKGYRKCSFQNIEDSISIPCDIELIESFLNLLQEHCHKELKIYKEALCRL